MLYPEDTKFLVGCILLFLISFFCLWQGILFGAMSCFVLSVVGMGAHFKARRKEKQRKREEEDK